jgi:NAD(P)-dependent dehydrogenase (short-subunit alcohol dehydrogenase family)
MVTRGEKWTTDDIGDQHGRTAVITGANTGLGYETAVALADKGARVVLACRNLAKAESAAESIRARNADAEVEVLALDLGDLSSIRDAAGEAHTRFGVVDLLINNAGVMIPPHESTADGFELQFGTNHLGHFALSALMYDLVEAAPAGRIVTVSSNAHKLGTMAWGDLQSEQRYRRVAAYGQSKLANLLFTNELARRLDAAGLSVLAVAAHPGASTTELVRHVPGYRVAPLRVIMDAAGKLWSQSASMGALPTLRAATDPHVVPGDYFGPRGLGEQKGYPEKVGSSEKARNTADARRLWEISEDLTKVTWELP